MTEETENPATFDVEPEAKEDAQPPEQGAADAMLAQIQAQQLRLQELEQAVRAQQGGEEVLQASPSESADEGGALLVFASKAARHVFAERVTTPACFHQITTVTLLDADAPMLSKASFLLTSLLLLMLQQMTLTSVAAGVSAPSCVDNNDCAAGSYCKMLTEERGFCLMCLRADGVTPFFGDGSALNATAYCATVPTDDPVCMACYDGNLPGDGWNIGWNMRMRFNAATNRMCGGDWAALILVASVVGLYVAGELRDIKLCQITFETRDGSSAPAWVQAALLALGAWRQFAFLGMLTHIVAMLVLHRGSDAISICFNGVAVLFLLDVDVYLFEFWVPEKMRERMEEFGAPTVSEDDAQYLAILKRYHAILVAFFIFLAVLQTGALPSIAESASPC